MNYCSKLAPGLHTKGCASHTVTTHSTSPEPCNHTVAWWWGLTTVQPVIHSSQNDCRGKSLHVHILRDPFVMWCAFPAWSAFLLYDRPNYKKYLFHVSSFHNKNWNLSLEYWSLPKPFLSNYQADTWYVSTLEGCVFFLGPNIWANLWAVD